METKKLVEKARALLAAATQGPWVPGRASGRLHRHGCPGLNDAGRCNNVWSADSNCDVTAPCAGLSAADAALIAFAVNNLPAMLDALAAAENRADEAEDARGLAVGQLDAARANLTEREFRLDNQNAGMQAMAQQRDAARRDVERLSAKVARMEARTAGLCECATAGRRVVVAPDCPACKGSGAVIVEAP